MVAVIGRFAPMTRANVTAGNASSQRMSPYPPLANRMRWGDCLSQVVTPRAVLVALAINCWIAGCEKTPEVTLPIGSRPAEENAVPRTPNPGPRELLVAASQDGSSVTTALNEFEAFEHDAGDAIAGTLVSHSFIFLNSSTKELVIDRDDDIAKYCGCTELRVGTRKLAAGGKTSVSVSVDTTGRFGVTQKGGSIVWTAVDGTRRVVQFSLACDVIPAFETVPAAMSFGADDVSQGTVKEIRVSSRLPIDWMTICATTTSTTFEVVDCTGERAGGGLFRIKCLAQPEMEAEQAFARISAELRSSDGESRRRVSAILPLVFRQVIALEARPLLATMHAGADGSGTTKLLLSGPQLLSHKVDSVTADGFDIGWSWHAAQRDVGFLTARLRPLSQQPPQRGELAIECGPGKPLLVPFAFLKVPAKDAIVDAVEDRSSVSQSPFQKED